MLKIMKTKYCSGCKKEHPISEFYKNKSTKDGLETWCKTCRKQYAEEHRQELYRYNRNYYKRNKEKRAKQNKLWRENNKEWLKTYHKDDKNKKRKSELSKIRRLKDPILRKSEILSGCLYYFFKNNFKSNSCILDIIGCSGEQLKKHFEKLFESGMTWDNHGCKGWYIDHIVPRCAFDLTKIEEQKKCFHYLNLQPLWAIDNSKKRSGGNKYSDHKK